LLIKGFSYFWSSKKVDFKVGHKEGKTGQSDGELSSGKSRGMMSSAKPMARLNTESKPENICGHSD
jgi:hypothetical protein